MRDALQSVADGQMEFDEAVKWEVKISGLPTFYADGKSKGEVKMMLRKLLKRPDEIVSIERTTSAELKKIRRAQIQGNEPGDDEEEVKEQLLLEDNRAVKVQNKELSIDDIINMIQFGKPFDVVDEDIPATLPPGDPNFPRYKDIPNSLVDKEDKKANKVKNKAEKDTLVPTETQEALDTWHPDPEKDKKSTSYKHHAKRVSDWTKSKEVERKDSERLAKQQAAREKRHKIDFQDLRPLKKESRARQAQAAQVWLDEYNLSITQKGLDALRKDRDRRAAEPKVSITKKGLAALEKDKKNQNKDPVGKQHEGIVSGAGKVAGAALGGAIGLGVNPFLGTAVGAGIIKKTSDIQKKLDKKKADRKAEQERAKAAAQAEREKKDPRLSHEEVEIDEVIYGIPVGKKMAGTTTPPKQKKGFRGVGKPPAGWKDRKAGTKAGDMYAEYDPIEVKTSRTVMGGQEYEVIEVAPPGWGHTVAKKEKTKPDKPKSKIGGSAHEFQKDLDSGKFKGLPGDKSYKDKKASMFKLMWSMKNKGDKPHYKPGVKDKLKAKYKKDESVLDSAKRYLS